MTKGWKSESVRHSLARKGVKTGATFLPKGLFFIKPRNEGQELNYSETFKGDFLEAGKRAREMATKLQKTLKQGSITVDVEDEEGSVIQTRLPSRKVARKDVGIGRKKPRASLKFPVHARRGGIY